MSPRPHSVPRVLNHRRRIGMQIWSLPLRIIIVDAAEDQHRRHGIKYEPDTRVVESTNDHVLLARRAIRVRGFDRLDSSRSGRRAVGAHRHHKAVLAGRHDIRLAHASRQKQRTERYQTLFHVRSLRLKLGYRNTNLARGSTGAFCNQAAFSFCCRDQWVVQFVLFPAVKQLVV
jgi:hypothetical protein